MNTPFMYDIRFPEKMESNKKYPVIFALHGIGSNEQNILSLLDEVNNEFILIGIRGKHPHNQGFSFFNIIRIGFPHREQFDDSVKNLADFIAYATEKYPIDPEARYLFGFSQGAILSMTLAIAMGNQLKGIVALNGYIPQFVKDEYDILPMDQVTVYVSHGEFDSVFPLEIGENNAEFFRKRVESLHYKSYPAGHEVTLENQRDFVSWLRQSELNK